MAFDATSLQYLEDEDWRVLTAIETGQRNHELVAAELVHSISGLRGGIQCYLDTLVRNRLISHEGKPYNGYQLTKAGYDFLAIHSLVKKGIISTLGCLIGQGKEADVYTGHNEEGEPVVLKFHRVGRVSFRKAKDTRDYLSKVHTSSWLYLSRLSAQQEFKNLTLLQKFSVPRAIAVNRHCVVMSLIPGTLLNNVQELPDPHTVFEECVALAVELLKCGLVHADFSQYNILVNDEDQHITLIDFPQTMKYTHPDAERSFNHDIDELRRFFNLRFDLTVENVPRFADFEGQITPLKLDSGEEEETGEEEEVDEEAAIRARVSKENRFRRKPKYRKPSKPQQKLRMEVKQWSE